MYSTLHPVIYKAKMLRQIRQILDSEGFLEIMTPILRRCNAASDLVLNDPEDGTVEQVNAQLPGGVNRGHTTGQMPHHRHARPGAVSGRKPQCGDECQCREVMRYRRSALRWPSSASAIATCVGTPAYWL
ncbi:hypothetical protein FHT09_003796 [Xanthomonas arboricola]|nr:hypothetical protein [Xanthomonas sp. CFBP 8152]MBB5738003.1 hypothetical protein [Xanthomonas sp. CFBP 8152]